MELRDFISQALQDIANGIVDAQGKTPDGATVNPADTRGTDAKAHGLNGNPVQNVEFDVALTLLRGSETKGGIGVFAGAINLGSSGKSETANTSYSRVKFSIPMVFTQQSERREKRTPA